LLKGLNHINVETKIKRKDLLDCWCMTVSRLVKYERKKKNYINRGEEGKEMSLNAGPKIELI
jgi:hypothetical protein